MSGSVYFKGSMVRGDMTGAQLLCLSDDLPRGTRCIADYYIDTPVFKGKSTFGWNAGSTELTLLVTGFKDKQAFFMDDNLGTKLSIFTGQLAYMNT